MGNRRLLVNLDLDFFDTDKEALDYLKDIVLTKVRTGDIEKDGKRIGSIEEKLLKQTSLRFRLKNDKDFYRPAGDISLMLETLLRISTVSVGDNYDDALVNFIEKLTTFITDAKCYEGVWEDKAVDDMNDMLLTLVETSDYAIDFLLVFFRSIMHWYWHSIRLTPDDEKVTIKDMVSELENTSILSRLPKDLRLGVLDHFQAYNIFPKMPSRDNPAVLIND